MSLLQEMISHAEKDILISELRIRILKLEEDNQKLRDRREKYVERIKTLENALAGMPFVLKVYADQAERLSAHLKGRVEIIKEVMKK